MRWVFEPRSAKLFIPLLLCLAICPAFLLCAEDDPNSDNSKNNNKKDSDSADNDPGRNFGLYKASKAKNKDADLTPEQLREKTLKQMKEQQDKAQKEQAKWEKKQQSKKATQ